MESDILYPLRRLHGMIHEWKLHQQEKWKYKHKYARELKAFFQKNENGVILALTPEHTNLGDHAIAFAEIEMLRRAEINCYEITGKEIDKLRKYNKLDIMNGYPIVVTGGGNLGTLWFGIEVVFREIVISNPRSKILLCPNTIYYEDSQRGQKEFEESKRIYNQHEQLCLYAREMPSFEVMNKAYKNVKLIPDVVLSLNKSFDDTKRSGCLLCLRKDHERTRTDADEECILGQVKSIFKENYRYTDMSHDHEVNVEQRELELEKKYCEFRGAELVITDRLHGMIFAAVTGTPCIVINSKSPKLKGSYHWIEGLEYIRFAENGRNIASLYRSIPQKTHRYDNNAFAHYYRELVNDIREMI